VSRTIKAYPELDTRLLNRICVTSDDFKMSYHTDNETRELDVKQIESSSRFHYFKIEDPNCEWNPDEHKINYSRKYTINNPSILFGENGIAPSNSLLGLVLIWTSKASSMRGTQIIGKFSSQSKGPLEFDLKGSFNKGILKGDVQLTTSLYLAEAGARLKSEMHLINKQGTLLGEIENQIMIVDGVGSIFPVVEVYEPNEPLWWVYFDVYDISSDPFNDDNIRIEINKGHKDYEALMSKKGLEENEFLTDIIASAIQLIIQKALSDTDFKEDIINDENLEPDSIGKVISYFINSLEFDISSPELMAKSIRSFMMKQV